MVSIKIENVKRAMTKLIPLNRSVCRFEEYENMMENEDLILANSQHYHTDWLCDWEI